MRIPLGEREGQHLEFKAAEIVRNPESIAKSVVALLNAEGGDLWIGLHEQNEYATGLDPVPDAEAAARSIRDHVLDTVEPAPSGKEVSIEVVRHESGARVVRVRVEPIRDRVPYAYVRGTARHFVVRVGSRVRPMERDEILRESPGEPALANVERKLLAESGREEGLTVRVQPLTDRPRLLEVADFSDLLMYGEKSGNRRAETGAWTFANKWQNPAHEPGRLVQKTGTMKSVTLAQDGSMSLHVARNHLRHEGLQGAVDDVYPFAVLEYPTSVIRLAATVYAKAGVECREVMAHLALVGIRGWTLRPGSPRLVVFRESTRFQEDDFVGRLHRFRMQELREQPDRCAAALWQEVYWAFGYGPADWPPEYDAATGRLAI